MMKLQAIEKTKEGLHKFFRITTAVFDAMEAIQEALGGKGGSIEMVELHRKAKKELDKDKPNYEVVMSILDQIIELTDELKTKHQENEN